MLPAASAITLRLLRGCKVAESLGCLHLCRNPKGLAAKTNQVCSSQNQNDQPSPLQVAAVHNYASGSHSPHCALMLTAPGEGRCLDGLWLLLIDPCTQGVAQRASSHWLSGGPGRASCPPDEPAAVSLFQHTCAVGLGPHFCLHQLSTPWHTQQLPLAHSLQPKLPDGRSAAPPGPSAVQLASPTHHHGQPVRQALPARVHWGQGAPLKRGALPLLLHLHVCACAYAF